MADVFGLREGKLRETIYLSAGWNKNIIALVNNGKFLSSCDTILLSGAQFGYDLANSNAFSVQTLF